MRSRRLFWHLYPSYLLVTVLCLAVAGWFVEGAVRGLYLTQVARELEAKARMASQHIAGAHLLTAPRRLQDYCTQVGKVISTRLTVILPSGKVVGDSHRNPALMDNHADRPEIRTALGARVGRSVRYSHTLHTRMMYVAVPLVKEGKILGVVRCSKPLKAVHEVLGAFRAKALVGLMLAAGLAGVLCLVVSSRITRPLAELIHGARALSHGQMTSRIRLSGRPPREFALLAQAMNHMAAELERRIQALAERGRELEAILTSMSEGLVAVDEEGRVVSMNHAAARLLGVQAQQVRGLTLEEAVRNPALQAMVRQVLATGECSEAELTLGPHDQERMLQARAVALKAPDGSSQGVVVVLSDITRLRRAERARKDFVASVSHELKTPITAIKGFAETLLDGAMNEPMEAGRFLRIISSHAERMEKIVQDLLMLSRLDQLGEGQWPGMEEVELGSVVRSAIETCMGAAQAKEISVELAVGEPCQVRANARLLEQAVVNLVDNAISYSEPGAKVQVRVGRQEQWALVEVSDEGCGIAPEHLERIFERFYRVDKARSRKQGGTGLGLAIVKHVAQVHGGRVSVRSIPGKGSTFTIFLPLLLTVAPRACKAQP